LPLIKHSPYNQTVRPLETLYEDTRGRIVELVEGLDDEDAAKQAPACPAWSVHDIVAHLTGNCADVVSGNVGGVATDEWTAAQVTARAGRTVPEILSEWDKVGPQVAAWADDFPGHLGVQFVADATVHEHDVRGALGRPGARDSAQLALALDFLVTVVAHAGTAALGLGPLEVRAGEQRWLVGTGAPPTGDVDEETGAAVLSTHPTPPPGLAPVGTLTAEPFELFRALTGRRSRAQIRGFDWTVDPEPYLQMFASDPFFTIRPTDLEE
jgi:uncharacterized protein (TIGR03083 family)